MIMVILLAAACSVMAAPSGKTVKVFILAGQSNMVGHGKTEMGRNPAWTKDSKGVPREMKGGVGCLEFRGTVASVDTRSFVMPDERNPSTQVHHWGHSAESHYLVGNAMGEAMIKLLNGK